MELLSRVDKYKVNKSKGTDLSGVVCFILYGLLIILMLRYLRISEMAAFRQTLQMSLFFSSIFFLDLYLLAFTVASTKKFIQHEEKVARAKPLIIVIWAFSLLYHFSLWLASHPQLISGYYYFGIAFTLGALFLTLNHFYAYFSYVKWDNHVQAKALISENRRQAYEALKRIIYSYQVIQETMERSPEVKQMMRWNFFDQQMERLILEMECYLQATVFTKDDMENIMGVHAWMDNLLSIIEQHPMHHDLFKKFNV